MLTSWHQQSKGGIPHCSQVLRMHFRAFISYDQQTTLWNLVFSGDEVYNQFILKSPGMIDLVSRSMRILSNTKKSLEHNTDHCVEQECLETYCFHIFENGRNGSKIAFVQMYSFWRGRCGRLCLTVWPWAGYKDITQYISLYYNQNQLISRLINKGYFSNQRNTWV